MLSVRRTIALALCLAFTLALMGTCCASRSTTAPAAMERDATSATPLSEPGLPNLHRVTPNLYRGAQPTAEGFRRLKEMGIRTVVNLRSEHSDRAEFKGSDLDLVEIPTRAWGVADDKVVAFLKVALDPARQPVFVHCQHGADRTGLMVAAWRVAACGWTKDEAIREMTEGGFGYHSIWKDLIEDFRKADVERLKRSAILDD